jgi:hypothetical protein
MFVRAEAYRGQRVIEDVLCGSGSLCADFFTEFIHCKEVRFGNVAYVSPVEEVGVVPDLPFCLAASDDFCQAFEVLSVTWSTGAR